MSDRPSAKFSVVPCRAVPRDMVFVVQQGAIVGGMRSDEEDGWTIYSADEAIGMAELLRIKESVERAGL
jgi:hypothetical protein